MSTEAPILAAHRWPSNAALIADVARLGYLTVDDHVLDPTYGRGKWWTTWAPHVLETHDIAIDGIDFRALPESDGTFDAAVFDPPYVCVGGRATTGIADMHDRYGLTDAPRTPADLQAMNAAGLAEVVRVVKPRGVVLVKCADYVWSGRLFPGTHLMLSAALEVGCELIDRFEHVGNPRPQPKRTRADGQPVRQHHARRNLSTLLVLRTAKR